MRKQAVNASEFYEPTTNSQELRTNNQELTTNNEVIMAAKKSFVLRIDEATYAALEKWAADEFRSVNGQLEWIVNQALRDSGRVPKERKATPLPDEEKLK